MSKVTNHTMSVIQAERIVTVTHNTYCYVQMVKISWRNHEEIIFLRFDTIPARDRRTDRQTDGHVAVAKTRASVVNFAVFNTSVRSRLTILLLSHIHAVW